MSERPKDITVFEFVVVAAKRAAQLMQGCTPRVEPGAKKVITARREVAEGHVRALDRTKS